MSKYDCPTCGEFTVTGAHQCHPEWLVWRTDSTEDDARMYRAGGPDLAVAMWAETEDRESADHLIVHGSDAEVFVRAVRDGGVAVRYVVSGESVPSYSARRRSAEGGGS